MTDTYDKAVERRARAIYDLFIFDEPTGTKPDWVERGNSLKQDEARRMARATLEADDAAGYALVPKVLTEEMDLRACEADHADYSESAAGDQSDSIADIWNAAIAAGAVRRDEG